MAKVAIFIILLIIGTSLADETHMKIILKEVRNQARIFYRKDYSFLSEVNAFFKFHIIARNFSKAVATCASEGAELYRPGSLKESEIVVKAVVKRPTMSVWIGFHDIYSEGHFISLKGVPIEELYSNWARDEPNDNDDEDCVELNVQDMTFNDNNCRTKWYFICKKDIESLTQNPQCQTHDVDYMYSSEMDACYKIHTSPKVWSEAFAMCRAELADLAIIDSEREAKFLTREVSKLADSLESYYFIGFSDIINRGVHLTIQGKTLSESGYEKWSPDRPETTDDIQLCGAMTRSGLLTEAVCDTKAMFICENSLPSFEDLSDSGSQQAGIVVKLPDV